jgi:acetyltransferase
MKPEINWTLGEWWITVRPIAADDQALWLELMRTMSWSTRYMRGARRFEDLKPGDDVTAVNPDPATEIVFVAIATRGDVRHMAGVARGSLQEGQWEFGLVVLDEWKRRGVGRRVMLALINELARRGARRLEGHVLASNRSMLDFVRRLGFVVQPGRTEDLLRRVVLELPDVVLVPCE